MGKIIVESIELLEIVDTLEMYANILAYVDESDVDDVEGYAEEIKKAAADLRAIAEDAAPVNGR